MLTGKGLICYSAITLHSIYIGSGSRFMQNQIIVCNLSNVLNGTLLTQN